jgi:predicted DNA-binding protein
MERKLISFYIDLEQAERLNKLSKKTKVSGAMYIRKGLAIVLKKHENQLKDKGKKKRRGITKKEGTK